MGLTILRLGRMGYQQALTVQQRLVEKVFVLELSFTESLLR